LQKRDKLVTTDQDFSLLFIPGTGNFTDRYSGIVIGRMKIDWHFFAAA
jgi:hypothetical protein